MQTALTEKQSKRRYLNSETSWHRIRLDNFIPQDNKIYLLKKVGTGNEEQSMERDALNDARKNTTAQSDLRWSSLDVRMNGGGEPGTRSKQ